MSTAPALDLACLSSSLSIFDKTSISELRQKSLKITAYLEFLLIRDLPTNDSPYAILTPSDPEARGAQLSIKLKPGLLPPVSQKLSADGFVFDQRKPDVMRIAPAPLYNTYTEVWEFVNQFRLALEEQKVLK